MRIEKQVVLHQTNNNNIMKKNVVTIGILATLVLGFVSCKDEKQEQAEKTVNNYVVYVDSLGNVASDDAKANWTAIDANYQVRVAKAEISLEEAKDNQALKEKLEASKAKYDAMKAKYQAELEAKKVVVVKTPNQLLRDRFFGEGKVGEDMNFSWVNKDNILKVRAGSATGSVRAIRDSLCRCAGSVAGPAQRRRSLSV